MSVGEQHEIEPGISAVLAVGQHQKGIENLILELGAVLDGLVEDNFEIIVVEFGPNPPTPGLMADLIDGRPSLPLLVLPDAYPDQVDALSAGFDASRFDLLFVTSPDGQFDVRELNHLLETIEGGADLAVGYRIERIDGVLQRLDGWAWNLVASVLFGRTARDVECAFKLFRRVIWERLEPRPRRGTFNPELLSRARRMGFLIDEVPVRQHRPHQSAAAGVTAAVSSSRHAA